MKPSRVGCIVIALLSFVSPGLAAADFGWMEDFNVTASADPSGFRVRLAARFKVGDAQIKAVISNCERPADAYMVLRCGELSGRPVEQVLEQFRKDKGKGWGVIAQQLGIKPGSEEFHALKRSDDLYSESDRQKGKGKGKGKGKR